MGLVNSIDLFNHAEKHLYAVGAFNIINLDFLNGILEAAEEVQSPVILNIAEAHFPYINIEQITPAIKYMADNSCVSVVLNLDHGLSIETIVRALRCGFSSVMYDASKKPINQNIEETRLVVKMAHAVGVNVEAELGQVREPEGGEKATRAKREFFTNPAEAERFVAKTGIDSLAVSVGNVHGFYKGEPELDFELIAELKHRTGIPLVLHGGSGISDDDFRRSISCGIRKINYYTEMSKVTTDRMKELLASNGDIFIHDLQKAAKEKIKETVMDRMRVFGSAEACTLADTICPSGGSCTRGATSKVSPEPKPIPVGLKTSAVLSQAEISDIITQVVSRILKK